VDEPARNREAKEAMLGAIRRNLSASRAGNVDGHRSQPPVAPAGTAVSGAPEPACSLTSRFKLALEAVGGRCTIVRSEEEAAARVGEILDETRAARVAVSNASLVQAVIGRVKPGPRLLQDAEGTAHFECDVGISTAQWAIAESGTLVLESDAERHRLVSLVPAVHVALLRASRIRQTLSEVLGALGDRESGLSRTITLITGPSRTSDIELTLAIGVHGPGQLDVVVLDERAAETRP
jgi:L-lactate utilization protein LutC